MSVQVLAATLAVLVVVIGCDQTSVRTSGAPLRTFGGGGTADAVTVLDSTGLVTGQEAGIALPDDVSVEDIVVVASPSGDVGADIFWMSVPCQPGATITLSGTAPRIFLSVRPEPPLKEDCVAEGDIHGIRLSFDRPAAELTIDARLEPVVVPED